MQTKTVVSLTLAALAIAGCGSSKDNKSSTSAAAGSTAPAQSAPQTSATACKKVSAPSTGARKAKKPRQKLDPGKTYTITMQTNCGSFSFDLDVKTSPKGSASFDSLAKKGFFDKTIFHRIVPDFVIQGGDPTAGGTGGPGYKTVDKPSPSQDYPKGTVAMAKAGNESPGTAGSQFFVVTSDQGGAQLTPDYAVVGHVTKGMDVVDKIAALGSPTEQPTQVVEIEKATVSEK
ncbi:MAG: peptidylprolyl isomerase [Thermoleophilaceae bacterium]